MCVGLKTQNLNFYFCQHFFLILSCSISQCMIYIILYCNILLHIFIIFPKIYTFTRLYPTDLVFYIFSVYFNLVYSNLINLVFGQKQFARLRVELMFSDNLSFMSKRGKNCFHFPCFFHFHCLPPPQF